MQPPGIITPVVIGRKRKFVLRGVIRTRAIVIVYKAINAETEDQFTIKEYDLSNRTKTKMKSILNRPLGGSGRVRVFNLYPNPRGSGYKTFNPKPDL